MDEANKPRIQADIQVAHEEREREVHEPLYGLAPEPGAGGPASVGDAAQPKMEVPVEEPAEHGEEGTNLTWGIVLGAVLFLAIMAIVLYYGVGNAHVSAPVSTYPMK
jgi:hypothetical protein